jgi:hypothetical protein
MVLQPIVALASDRAPARNHAASRSAWEAVEDKQRQPAQEWWLIAQPDHAALAGDLAALLDSSLLPKLEEQVLRAISLHDAGWARFDGGERGTGCDLEVSLRDPKTDAKGTPLSFLEMLPQGFITAWEESIQKANDTSLLGGLMVSEHFCRLARSRARSHADSPEDKHRLHEFLRREASRQQELQGRVTDSREQVALLTDVLQFCDLLSLYLCCGAQDDVVFPQTFGGESIVLSCENGMYRLQPSILGDGASLGVTARRFPDHGAVEVGTLAFLIR